MRLNRYLTSTLLAGLFVSAAVFSPAMGQEQAMQPKGAWAITKVDRSAQGGNSYCTLSRKYDSGVVLSLGRNQTEEYSMAIDFQKDTFVPDKALKISLQPGPGQIRAYDMMPTSKKAVVIRLGWDTGFFDALNQSQEMKVKIADNSYAFSMPEIAKGQNELSDCMKDLKVAAKGDKAEPASTTDVLSAEAGASSKEFGAAKAGEKVALASAKDEIEVQEKQILKGFADNMRRQEPSLNDEPAAKGKSFAKTNDDEMPQKKIAAAKSKDAGAEEIAPASGEIVRRPLKMPEPDTAAIESAATQKKLEAERVALQDKIKKLEQESAKAQRDSAASTAAIAEKSQSQIQTLEQRMTALAAENEKLKLTASGVSDAQKKVQVAEAEKAKLQAKADAEKAKLQETALADKAALQAKAEAEKAALQARIEADKASVLAKAEADKASVLAKAEAEKANVLAKVEAEKTALQARMAKVEEEKRKAAEASATLTASQQKTAADLKSLETKLAALSTENDALKQQAQASSGENATLKQQAASMTAENATLKQQTASTTTETQKQLGEANAARAALEEKVKTLEQESQKNAMAASAAAAAAANAAKVPPGIPEEKYKALEQQMTELAAENAVLKKAAPEKEAAAKEETSKTAARIAEMEQKMAALTAENATLKAAPKPASGESNAQVSLLQQQVAALKAENDTFKKTTMTPLPDAIGKEEFDKVQAENRALQDKIAEMEKISPAAGSGEASVAAQAQLKELEIKNAQLEENLRNSQIRIGETAINTETKSLKKIVDLESKLEAAQRDNTTLAKQLDGMRLQQEDKRLSLVAGDWDLESATKRFNEAEREIRRLGLQLEQERTGCNREKAEIENMLFDPAVTEQKQLERLNTLESQLEKAEAAIGDQQKLVQYAVDQQLAEKTQTLEAQKAALEQQLASREPAAGGATPTTMQADNKEAEKLKADNAALREEAQKLRAQIDDVQTNGTQRADQVAAANLEVRELKRQMALKDKQNLTYQNQLASLQKEKARENMDVQARPEPQASARMETPSRDYADIQPAAGAVIPAAVKPPAKAAAPSGSGYSKSSIESLLKKSGLSVGSVQKSGAGSPGADSFSWSDKKVKGTASVSIMQGAGFDAMVQQYIAYQKGQCGGDFASMPSPSAGGSKPMAMYEMACVGASESTSSSMVFFEDQGRFIAISNQTGAQDMDMAMDSRDKIAGFVKGL